MDVKREELARRLGVELDLLVFDGAAKSVEAVREERADIGFFAVDPKRSDGIAFTAPYVLIEGSYMVREDSPLRANEDVDRAGRRVVVGQGSAYDLFLTREIQHASLVRAAGSHAVVQDFLDSGAQVAAGIRQPLEAEALRRGGLRVLPGRFMVIQQAMGCPKGRGDATAAALAEARAGTVSKVRASGRICCCRRSGSRCRLGPNPQRAKASHCQASTVAFSNNKMTVAYFNFTWRSRQ